MSKFEESFFIPLKEIQLIFEDYEGAKNLIINSASFKDVVQIFYDFLLSRIGDIPQNNILQCYFSALEKTKLWLEDKKLTYTVFIGIKERLRVCLNDLIDNDGQPDVKMLFDILISLFAMFAELFCVTTRNITNLHYYFFRDMIHNLLTYCHEKIRNSFDLLKKADIKKFWNNFQNSIYQKYIILKIVYSFCSISKTHHPVLHEFRYNLLKKYERLEELILYYNVIESCETLRDKKRFLLEDFFGKDFINKFQM
jgi:hypothetical protein